MKILVLSDTHNKIWSSYMSVLKQGHFDSMIHCGDCYDDAEKIAKELNIADYVRVPGNCDYALRSTQKIIVKDFCRKKFVITHGDKFGVKASLDYIINYGEKTCGTEIRSIPLSAVHLGRVAAINDLSRQIVSGKYTVEEAKKKLEEIRNIPYSSDMFQIFASALGSACFCYLFGGNLFDSATSLILGALLYVFVIWAGKRKLTKIITNVLGSAIVTL